MNICLRKCDEKRAHEAKMNQQDWEGRAKQAQEASKQQAEIAKQAQAQSVGKVADSNAVIAAETTDKGKTSQTTIIALASVGLVVLVVGIVMYVKK
jgi:hypothetical protein